MLDKADAYLKISAAFALAVAGLSTSYYFAIFMPNRQRIADEKAERKEEAERQASNSLIERKAKAALQAKDDYKICLSNAVQNYSLRWDSTCRRLNAEDLERRNKCISNYGESNCSNIEVRPASDCLLPNALGDDYDDSLKDAKQICVEELKAARSEL